MTRHMLKIKAHIKLFSGGRKTPFYNGYRPLFNFIEDMKTSDQIDLISSNQFSPGDEGEVEITFLTSEYLGADFKVGKKFSFGEGVVTEILNF